MTVIQELISCIAEYILVFIFIYGTYEVNYEKLRALTMMTQRLVSGDIKSNDPHIIQDRLAIF